MTIITAKSLESLHASAPSLDMGYEAQGLGKETEILTLIPKFQSWGAGERAQGMPLSKPRN